MSTLEFNNNKNIIKKETVKVKLDEENKISKIEYYTPTGVLVKEYQYSDSPIYERLNQYKIMQMAYILCLFDTEKFYELYNTLSSDSDKEAMATSLKTLLYKYQKYTTSNDNESDIDLPILNRTKEFSTLGNSLSTSDNKIILNNNHIDTCSSDFIIIGEPNKNTVSYNRNLRYPYTENNTQYRVLNKNICREFAKQLCRSDSEEYQRLVDSISYRDPYYSSVIEGGTSFANSIKKLVKKCQ